MQPLEIGLSFVEGMALIASPCILPVLPLVLGTSVDGGRGRPFGIITGFVLAFTAFAMLSRSLILTLGISPDTLKTVSLVLLGLLGVVMLSKGLSERFSALTQRFANVGGTVSTSAKGGFGSGVLIGALIGAVWTPCAGPILAAVLVQVIRQESSGSALFIVAAFALGAGVPMLIISLTGRTLMKKLGFITRHTEGLRKGIGVIMLLAVAFIATGGDAAALFAGKQTQTAAASSGLQDALPNPYPAPGFSGINAWLNSRPLTMSELKGKVVLIDFWTYSCINCVRTLPYITAWDKAYRDKGLVIIGVHAPEFEFEKNQANVEAALKAHGITYPVAMDNHLDTWTNFHNQYWPAHYLINKEGQVVYTHFGEGNYAETEQNIRTLLGVGGTAEATPETSSTAGQTPETYLGTGRAERYAGSPELKEGVMTAYTSPPSLPVHHWALGGKWRESEEMVTSATAGASLQLHFTGSKVFLVLGTEDGKPVTATITLNGEKLTAATAGKDAPDGRLTVDRQTLYELIDQHGAKEGILNITADAPGLQAYAFTFGS